MVAEIPRHQRNTVFALPPTTFKFDQGKPSNLLPKFFLKDPTNDLQALIGWLLEKLGLNENMSLDGDNFRLYMQGNILRMHIQLPWFVETEIGLDLNLGSMVGLGGVDAASLGGFDQVAGAADDTNKLTLSAFAAVTIEAGIDLGPGPADDTRLLKRQQYSNYQSDPRVF